MWFFHEIWIDRRYPNPSQLWLNGSNTLFESENFDKETDSLTENLRASIKKALGSGHNMSR